MTSAALAGPILSCGLGIAGVHFDLQTILRKALLLAENLSIGGTADGAARATLQLGGVHRGAALVRRGGGGLMIESCQLHYC